MSQGTKKSALTWLRPLFAIVMLAAVAYWIPDWTDVLVWKDPASGAKVVVPGTIVGDWRLDTIDFEPARDAVVDPDAPPALAAEIVAGRTIHATRGSIGGFASTTHSWRPSMPRVFRGIESKWLVTALAFLLGAAATSIVRWWRLLAVAGCRTTLATATRLTFLGFFFNLVVPGLTGGDVIKAALVVRDNPGRRADALMSVVVDRGIGLVVLVGLAAGVVLFSSDAFADVRVPVIATFAGMMVLIFAAMHSAPRRLLRLDRVLRKLPQQERLQSLDRALRIYADHPLEMTGAVLLSAGNHALIATGIYFLGQAFGDHLDWIEYLGITAIANVVSSLPVAPAGWGVGEFTFGYLFHLLGSIDTLGVAISVTYRLLMMALGLAGGLFLLMPGGSAVREELETSDAEADSKDDAPIETRRSRPDVSKGSAL